MRALLLFLTISHGLLLAAAQPQAGPQKWEKDIQAFESADKTNPPPANAVLFIGSSSIRLWKSLQRDFPETPVINRGFGGSHIADSTFYADRIIAPAKPRKIVLYAGGNDLNAGKSPEEVLADFKAFVEKTRQLLPHVPIAYISIGPSPKRVLLMDKSKQANALIEEYIRRTPGLEFIHVFDAVLDSQGKPRPELFVEDQLHLNEEGYKIWARIVRPYVIPSGVK